MSEPSVCLIDPSLIDTTGHFYEYARCLYEEAQLRRHRYLVLGHCQVTSEVRHRLPIEPVFRHTFFHYFAQDSGHRWLNPLLANWAFYSDLQTAIKKGVNPDWTLFMPTTSHHETLAWSWWLQRQPLAPSLVLLFRGYYYSGRVALYWAKLGFRWLERLAGKRHIRIATDSKRLAQQYRSLTCLPIEVFPIPHTRSSADKNGRFSSKPVGIRMVFLGDARAEKGFSLLVQALCQLSPELAAGRFEALIQCNIKLEQSIAEVRQVLQRASLPNVQLLTEPLKTEDYYSLLDNSDVVLIPYQQQSYYARTSGILAEAFAVGKPVVTTQDTWMAEQVENGGGGVLFRDGDADDLARAIREAVNRVDELRQAVERRRPAWSAFHNPKTLYDMLIRED